MCIELKMVLCIMFVVCEKPSIGIMQNELEKLLGNSTNLNFLSDNELFKLTESIDELLDSLNSEEIKELIKILITYQH